MTRLFKDKTLRKIWLTVLAIMLVYFSIIKISGHVYMFWGDETQETLPLLFSHYDMFRSGAFTFYNWSSGMGASYFCNFFKLLGAPSTYLYFLLPSKDLIVKAIPFVDTFRALLIATFAYLWMSQIVNTDKAKIVGTIVFTFSGYFCYWVHFSYFLDAYLYLAILLYALELLLKHKGKYLFIAIVALSAILTLYYLYMFTWTILLYLTMRLFMLNDHLKVKAYFKEFWYVLKYYLLGLGLSAIILIPCLFILSTTNRIGATTNLFSIIDIRGIYRVFTSLFSPVINDYDYNIYSSPFLLNDNVVYTIYSYSFMLFVLLVPQVIKMKFSGKKPLLIATVIFSLVLFFPLFYFIFNGNTSVRWGFMVVVLNVFLLAIIVDNIQQLNKKVLWISFIACVIYIATISFVSVHFNLTTNINNEVIKITCPVLIVFLALYLVSFNIKRFSTILLVLTLALESEFCLLLRVCNGSTTLIATNEMYYEYLDYALNNPLADGIEDDSFYRMEIADASDNAYNLPRMNNYYGFSQYVNVYNYESIAYIENRFTDSWFLPYNHSKFMLKSLWAQKYLIIHDKDEYYVPYGYHEIKELNGSKLYENSVAMPIAYATNSLSSYDYAQMVDKSLEDIIMLNSIVVQNNNNEIETPTYKLMATQLVNDGFKMEEKDGYLFIDYSMVNPITNIAYEFYKDGKVIKYGEVQEFGYTAIPVDQEVDEVYVYAVNFYNKNVYIPVDVYWISYEDIDRLYTKIDTYDKLENVQVNGDEVTGDINISNDGEYIATSIPYNDGWHAYVDGKEVAIENVNLAFVGLPIEKGQHSIHFAFRPKGLYVGMAVTGVSLVILVWIIISDHKKDKKKA